MNADIKDALMKIVKLIITLIKNSTASGAEVIVNFLEECYVLLYVEQDGE